MNKQSSWLWSRVGVRVLGGIFGALLGWTLGYPWDHPATAAVLGMMAAVLAVSVTDTLKGDRLLDWLRNPEDAPPLLPGLWGEVAHGVHRALRQREARISHERGRLSQFLSGIEASPNGVMLLDQTEHIVWISTAAASHFGLDPVRDLAQRVTNLVRVPAFVQYLAANRYDEPVKFQMPRSTEGTLSVVVRYYGDGQRIVLSQDVTERERSDLMRRDFVANVSHEIRTPLTVLNGFIETMSHLPLTEAERRRVLNLMQQQSTRMQHLVADLLTLAQIEGSPRPAVDKWCRLSELFIRMESDAAALSAGRHTLSFDAGTAGDCSPELSGVEGEWLSAMGNLVSNAIRYTPSGGSVSVKWVSLKDGGGEFSVTDTGIGIASEHLPRLTERFYRVDGSRSRETGGTGLGLAISKHVVQRHDGELRIQSEPGRGSTFSLLLPAPRVRVRRATPAPSSP